MQSPHLEVVNSSSQIDPSKSQWYKEPRRPISVIIADLSKTIPDRYLDSRKQGSTTLVYIPWSNAVKLLDRCTGAHWDYSITSITTTPERLILTARITIYAEEGAFSRDGTGTELLTCSSYGDPSSNAESMALRRAASKFGLGLYLYSKD